MEIKVRKAERAQAPLKILLSGASGSGKTYSALLLAKGMGGKILCLDTENKSADLYSDIVDFDKVDLDAPFTVNKYIEVMKYAEEQKYATIIVDSFTHCWAGEGGLLDEKGILDMKPGSNSFTNWAKLTPQQERLKSAIIQADINIIGCIRAKDKLEMTKDDNGRVKVEKMGLSGIQREGFEFEFTTEFLIDANHMAGTASGKDRTRLFDGKYFKITEQTGKDLIAWKQSAKPVERTPEQEKAHLIDKCKVLQITLDVAKMKTLDIVGQIAEMKALITAKEAK